MTGDPWPTFCPSVGIPVGVPLADAINIVYRSLREYSRVVKVENWGAGDRSSIPNVDSLQNAYVHWRAFKFDACSLKCGPHIVGRIAEHACNDA